MQTPVQAVSTGTRTPAQSCGRRDVISPGRLGIATRRWRRAVVGMVVDDAGRGRRAAMVRAGGVLVSAGVVLGSGAGSARGDEGEQGAGVVQKKRELGPVLDFAIGAVAGAVGAVAVYPVDFVKTRLQAQVDPCEVSADSLECEISQDLWDRQGGEAPFPQASSFVQVTSVAALAEAPSTSFWREAPSLSAETDEEAEMPVYSGAMDCVRQTIASGGVGALYAGLGPQLVGVAPEKAIKLAVNASMRSALVGSLHLTGESSLPLWAAMVAGGTAGLAQVIVTNPLEVVKIRLQMQDTRCDALGGCSPDEVVGPIKIMRDLGMQGLYKGAGACIARDAPFSAIFFPTYAALKAALPPGPLSLFLAGFLAGCPAAYLVTPFDVLKTRIQLKGNAGKGMRQIATELRANEGNAAFFKGGVQRVLRSAPQFGVTLFVFDTLTTLVLAHLP